MKALLFVALLFATAATAEPRLETGFIVWSDSRAISIERTEQHAPQYQKVWPGVMTEGLGVNFQNFSRAGRKATKNDLVAYLADSNTRANREASAILYALGNNDAFADKPIPEFEASLLAAIKEAEARGFNFYCITPASNWYTDNGWGAPLEAYRVSMHALCPVTFDQDDWVRNYEEWTYDGAHLTAEGHYAFAFGLFWALYNAGAL